jgi:hypothetical protein
MSWIDPVKYPRYGLRGIEVPGEYDCALVSTRLDGELVDVLSGAAAWLDLDDAGGSEPAAMNQPNVTVLDAVADAMFSSCELARILARRGRLIISSILG